MYPTVVSSEVHTTVVRLKDHKRKHKLSKDAARIQAAYGECHFVYLLMKSVVMLVIFEAILSCPIDVLESLSLPCSCQIDSQRHDSHRHLLATS